MRINYKTQIRAEIRKQTNECGRWENGGCHQDEAEDETSHEGNTREHVTKCTHEYGYKGVSERVAGRGLHVPSRWINLANWL